MQPAELEHLEQLRLEELRGVLEYLPSGIHLLEIGAGSGFQARDLAERGFQVEALDLASSAYSATRVFPVRDYDGRSLPFPERSFDVVFSSNLLEHVLELPNLLAEMQRVLRPQGVMVHVLPTATWRFWTTLALGPLIAKRIAQRVARGTGPARTSPDSPAKSPPVRGFGLRLRLLFSRHGEQGNVLSEVYLFSRHRWRGVFRQACLRVVAERSSRLFYTGHAVLGARMHLSTRRTLASMLGSSTRIWVLEPRA